MEQHVHHNVGSSQGPRFFSVEDNVTTATDYVKASPDPDQAEDGVFQRWK